MCWAGARTGKQPGRLESHPLAGLSLPSDVEQAVRARAYQYHAEPRWAATLCIHVTHILRQLLLPGCRHRAAVENSGLLAWRRLDSVVNRCRRTQQPCGTLESAPACEQAGGRERNIARVHTLACLQHV